MIWKHCNNEYAFNPTQEEQNDLVQDYLCKKYKRIFYIVDLENDITNFIKEISNPVFPVGDIKPLFPTVDNPITKLYFLLVRPNYAPKVITYKYKQEIKNLITELNIPKANVETIKEFRFRLYDTYVRITAIPNTNIADYMYSPLGFDDNYQRSPLIRVAGIENDSIVDGPGFRLTIFMQGCIHKCKECHNPETWDFKRGKFLPIAEIIRRIKRNPLLQGITLSGGDPFIQADNTYKIIKAIKQYNTETNNELDICVYTGYTLEELQDIISYCNNEYLLHYKATKYKNILDNIDYLVDGRFDVTQRTVEAKFRGSKNQKMYEVKHIDNNTTFTEIYPVEDK